MKKLMYEWELENLVEAEINDLYDPVKLLKREYGHGSVVRKADPVAWRMSVLDTIDSWVDGGSLKETVDKRGEQCWYRVKEGGE